MTGATPLLPQWQKHPAQQTQTYFKPISLTPVVCKVLEAILKEKVLAHLSKFSLLTSRQHGFLSRHSTQANLLVAEDLITNWLDEGSAVDLIYLDSLKPLIRSTIGSF